MNRRRSKRRNENLTLGLALGRSVLGASALVAPDALGRFWVGGPSGRTEVAVLARALAARDLALGLGTLGALRNPSAVRSWLRAGALADAGDAVATLAAFRLLPRRRRVVVPAVALSAVALALRLAGSPSFRRPQAKRCERWTV